MSPRGRFTGGVKTMEIAKKWSRERKTCLSGSDSDSAIAAAPPFEARVLDIGESASGLGSSVPRPS